MRIALPIAGYRLIASGATFEKRRDRTIRERMELNHDLAWELAPGARRRYIAAMSEPQVRTFTVAPDDDGIRLDRWFKRHLPEASFNAVSRWARTGQLRLDGKRAAPGDRVEAGQSIRVPPADPVAPARPAKAERPKLSEDEVAFVNEIVIHRDAAAIVVNKPPGLATQGGTKTRTHLDGLLDGLADEAGNRPKLVHRLDKDTSGVLLVARSARAAAFFSKSFSGRTARKVYWAIVAGVPDIAQGYIDLPLAKQPGTGGEKMHVDEENGLPARTRYRMVERAGNSAAWLELQPLTGRTHQLRAHMAAIGHPVVGDGKYGGQEAFLTGAISRKLHLHARRLRIDHPDGGQLDVTAELPPHFAETLANLGFDPALGELPIDEPKYSETPEGKRKAASAAAKERRRSRRGERRGRGRS
jgi:23S rRNA pseudouridine955/2504/2580 synthase